jgi:Fic family protein
MGCSTADYGGNKIPVSQETILTLHRLCRGEIWDGGKYKEKDGDIIERYANGRERVRFKTVSAAKTPSFIKELIEMWQQCLEERWVHPLIAMAAFNLDFLCIHPFRDGNGRVSRFFFSPQCCHLGCDGRYISLERLIENKDPVETRAELRSAAAQAGMVLPSFCISLKRFIVVRAVWADEKPRVQMR